MEVPSFLTHAKRVVFMFEHLKTDFENEFRLEQGSIKLVSHLLPMHQSLRNY